MKNKLLKSIGAILAGFIVGAVLSVVTDMILTKAGFMIDDPFKENAWYVILVVIFYRFVFNATGCYATAKLAPDKPMRHVIIIGIIGTVLAIAGSAAMWDKAVAWYNISIILISLPSAWLGGKLFIIKNKSI